MILFLVVIVIVVWIVYARHRDQRRREQVIREAQATLHRLLSEVSYCKGFIVGSRGLPPPPRKPIEPSPQRWGGGPPVHEPEVLRSRKPAPDHVEVTLGLGNDAEVRVNGKKVQP